MMGTGPDNFYSLADIDEANRRLVHFTRCPFTDQVFCTVIPY